MHYDQACIAAATRQGLDPITAALTAAGITHTVEQTGGFCMVVTVQRPTGLWAITHDGDYLVGWFPGNAWNDAREESADHTTTDLAEVVRLVSTTPGVLTNAEQIQQCIPATIGGVARLVAQEA